MDAELLHLEDMTNDVRSIIDLTGKSKDRAIFMLTLNSTARHFFIKIAPSVCQNYAKEKEIYHIFRGLSGSDSIVKNNIVECTASGNINLGLIGGSFVVQLNDHSFIKITESSMSCCAVFNVINNMLAISKCDVMYYVTCTMSNEYTSLGEIVNEHCREVVFNEFTVPILHLNNYLFNKYGFVHWDLHCGNILVDSDCHDAMDNLARDARRIATPCQPKTGILDKFLGIFNSKGHSTQHLSHPLLHPVKFKIFDFDRSEIGTIRNQTHINFLKKYYKYVPSVIGIEWKKFGAVFDIIRVITSFDKLFCQCLDSNMPIDMPQNYSNTPMKDIIDAAYKLISHCITNNKFKKIVGTNYHLAVFYITLYICDLFQFDEKLAVANHKKIFMGLFDNCNAFHADVEKYCKHLS